MSDNDDDDDDDDDDDNYDDNYDDDVVGLDRKIEQNRGFGLET